MKVEKISGTNLPLDNNDPERDQQRFESAHELDRKKLAKERFRKDMGMSQEEYQKQNERARKIGFDALLQESISKLKKQGK